MHRRRLASRGSGEGGRERDTGARITTAREGPSRAGRPQAPDICTSLRQSLAPTHDDRAGGPAPQADLTFIRSRKDWHELGPPPLGARDSRVVAMPESIGWAAGAASGVGRRIGARLL